MPKVGIAEERREQIIKATFFSIAMKGYSAITMQDIANSAGISKGVIHYYFKNKDDLFISVLGHIISDLDSFMTARLAEVVSPVDRLLVMISTVFENAVNNKMYHAVVIDFWAHATKNKALRQASANESARYRRLIQKIIEQGIATGEFREDVDTYLAAAALLGQMQGLLTQWTLNKDAFDLMGATAICQETIRAYLALQPNGHDHPIR